MVPTGACQIDKSYRTHVKLQQINKLHAMNEEYEMRVINTDSYIAIAIATVHDMTSFTVYIYT